MRAGCFYSRPFFEINERLTVNAWIQVYRNAMILHGYVSGSVGKYIISWWFAFRQAVYPPVAGLKFRTAAIQGYETVIG